MFLGSPRLYPSHIGKWIILKERWPDLARALSSNPDRLTELCATNGESSRPEVMMGFGATKQQAEIVVNFLSNEPEMFSVLPKLVYMLPGSFEVVER
jgi:hypothetical protein